MLVAVPLLATSLQTGPLKTDCSSVCDPNQVGVIPDCFTGILAPLLMQQGTKVPQITRVSVQLGHRRKYSGRRTSRGWVHVCHLKLEAICHKWTINSVTDATLTAAD